MVKVEKKSKLSFLFCACFPCKKKAPINDFEYIAENEPYDYVVEKCTIKKLPIRTFATAEDMKKYKNCNGYSNLFISSNVNHESTFPVTTTQESTTKDPGSEATQHEHKQAHQLNSHDLIMVHEKDDRSSAFSHQFSPKTVSVKDKEAHLITSILNKHATLYTLDDKNLIPKDPSHQPTDTVVIPGALQSALERDEKFPLHRNQIKAEVSKVTPVPPLKYPGRIPPSKKDMTPEIEMTINALKVAQKPHIPGIQPKNQKSVLCPNITSQLSEDELFGTVLGNVSENERSETSSQTSFVDKSNKIDPIACLSLTSKIVESYDTEKFLSNVNLQNQNAIENVNSSDLNTDDHSVKKDDEVINGSSGEKSSSTELVDLVPQKMNQSNPTNPLKYQNLKWKIIIKHHSDNTECQNKQEISQIVDNDESNNSEGNTSELQLPVEKQRNKYHT